MQYATIAQWAADPRTGTAPAPGSAAESTLNAQLVAASGTIDDALAAAVYRTNPDGSPLDSRLAAVLASACIDQQVYALELDPDGSGLSYGAMSLGSLQLPAGGASGSSGGTLSPLAAGRLAAAVRDGLMRMQVRG